MAGVGRVAGGVRGLGCGQGAATPGGGNSSRRGRPRAAPRSAKPLPPLQWRGRGRRRQRAGWGEARDVGTRRPVSGSNQRPHSEPSAGGEGRAGRPRGEVTAAAVAPPRPRRLRDAPRPLPAFSRPSPLVAPRGLRANFAPGLRAPARGAWGEPRRRRGAGGERFLHSWAACSPSAFFRAPAAGGVGGINSSPAGWLFGRAVQPQIREID